VATRDGAGAMRAVAPAWYEAVTAAAPAAAATRTAARFRGLLIPEVYGGPGGATRGGPAQKGRSSVKLKICSSSYCCLTSG